MSNDLTIQRTAEAVESPLVINSILESGVRNAPEQEIVYADQRRMSYRDKGTHGITEVQINVKDTVFKDFYFSIVITKTRCKSCDSGGLR